MNGWPPTGPEDLPLKEYLKSFPLVVFVYDIKNDKVVREEKIDYSNYKHRQWLGRVTVWACQNHYSVETMAQSDAD
jgi:hypothetical protein